MTNFFAGAFFVAGYEGLSPAASFGATFDLLADALTFFLLEVLVFFVTVRADLVDFFLVGFVLATKLPHHLSSDEKQTILTIA